MATKRLRRTAIAALRSWLIPALLAALALTLGPPPQAHAANITVNIADPSINADGLCSLIEAITNANDDASTHADCPAGSGADIIDLQATGPYVLTAVDNSTHGDNGLPSITSEITVNGNGATIERAVAAPNFRIFHVAVAGGLTLNELTVSNGQVSGSLPDSAGGGLLNYGTVELTNSTVSDNRATHGGGIYTSGTMKLTNGTVSDNNADDQGGGIFNVTGTTRLTNSAASGNGATEGGGIYNADDGAVELTNSTVSDNRATLGGGGIFNARNNMVALNKSTVSGNSAGAGHGGGIYNIGSLGMTNSTVSGNSATLGVGGGIFDANGGTVVLTNSTISDNSAIQGGGIFNGSGMVELTNVIVADNPVGGDCAGNPINSHGHNLDSDNTCNLTDPTDFPGTGPMLDPLQNNGGPTETHALLPGSPAIDTGENGTCAAPPVSNLDQRGQPRPLDGDDDGAAVCDIGAYELQLPGGQIDIIKQTDPEGATGFAFAGDLGSFSLDDDGIEVRDGLTPGDYDVTEAVPAGWDLISVVCIGGDSDPLANGVTIHLNAGEEITCTFTNQQCTAVSLTSFSASADADRITLDWETASEIDNEGFNVWRSQAADGEYGKLNAALIPAQGTADTGARYDYTDTDVVKGVTYYYQLEDVDIHGVSTFHGPVSATPLNFRPIWGAPAPSQDGPLK